MIKQLNKGVKKVLPFLLFFLFICYIIYSADTDNGFWLIQLANKIKYADKIGHLLLYGLLGALLNLALNHRKIGKSWIPLGTVIVLVFAITEEFTQLAFETRTFDLVDMLCDVVGLALISFRGNVRAISKSLPTKLTR